MLTISPELLIPISYNVTVDHSIMSYYTHSVLTGLVTAVMLLAPTLQADNKANHNHVGDQEQFRTLFSQLGSDSFPIRQVAQQKLQEAAGKNRELILEQSLNRYFETNDPEVRYRLRSTMFGIVGSSLRKEGFIGIRMMDAPVPFLNNRGNAQPERAVQILSVLPDTAASRAGLRLGDKIIRLDGKSFDNNTPAYFELSKYIRSKSSGDTVKLSLKRGIEEVELDLVLGGRPEGMDENRKAEAFSEWMDQQKNSRGILKSENEQADNKQLNSSENLLEFRRPSIQIVPDQDPKK